MRPPSGSGSCCPSVGMGVTAGCTPVTPSDALAGLAERNPPIEEVIKTGVIPQFVKFLNRAEMPQLQVGWAGHTKQDLGGSGPGWAGQLAWHPLF